MLRIECSLGTLQSPSLLESFASLDNKDNLSFFNHWLTKTQGSSIDSNGDITASDVLTLCTTLNEFLIHPGNFMVFEGKTPHVLPPVDLAEMSAAKIREEMVRHFFNY